MFDFQKQAETIGGHCCEPMTMIMVAATAMQAVGSIREGNAAKNEAEYQAEIANQNADIAAQQTQAQTDIQDRERRMRRGANIAASGASGVGLDSFSDILQGNAMQERLDILTIENEGLLQQRNFQNDANLAKARGKNAQTAGYIGAATTILGGASKLGGGQSGGLSSSQINAQNATYRRMGGAGPFRT